MTAPRRAYYSDPPIHHVDPKRDEDHYPRVIPGRMRGDWAACGDCKGAVRARWGGQAGKVLEIVAGDS